MIILIYDAYNEICEVILQILKPYSHETKSISVALTYN